MTEEKKSNINYLSTFTSKWSVPLPGALTGGRTSWQVGKDKHLPDSIEEENGVVRVYFKDSIIIYVAGGWGLVSRTETEKAEKAKAIRTAQGKKVNKTAQSVLSE